MLRLTQRGKTNIRRGLRRSWQPGGAHDLRFRHKEPDADTLRWRAYQDRKGSLFAEVRMGGEVFTLRHSTAHARRLDIFNHGHKIAVCRSGLALSVITGFLT